MELLVVRGAVSLGGLRQASRITNPTLPVVVIMIIWEGFTIIIIINVSEVIIGIRETDFMYIMTGP